MGWMNTFCAVCTSEGIWKSSDIAESLRRYFWKIDIMIYYDIDISDIMKNSANTWAKHFETSLLLIWKLQIHSDAYIYKYFGVQREL